MGGDQYCSAGEVVEGFMAIILGRLDVLSSGEYSTWLQLMPMMLSIQGNGGAKKHKRVLRERDLNIIYNFAAEIGSFKGLLQGVLLNCSLSLLSSKLLNNLY